MRSPRTRAFFDQITNVRRGASIRSGYGRFVVSCAAVSLALTASGCGVRGGGNAPEGVLGDGSIDVVVPRVVTEPVRHDTDDPAIWIHPDDPGKSLVIGTDKDEDGALFVYDLDGRVVQVVEDLRRPNNVDVAYGASLGGARTDVAVATERLTNRIRVFRLPTMEVVDDGGIEVFAGEEQRAPMGIALYTRGADGALFAIVGRKEGPDDEYLWRYRLQDDGTGTMRGELVRKFGAFSGREEIEAIAVDSELGYVYYSDERAGVRKYHADPDAPEANRELALFASEDFAGDHEGISIYDAGNGTGYLIVSDQQSTNEFHIFPREGSDGNQHDHPLLKVVTTSASNSDGSEVTSVGLNETFPAGLFVAMSDDQTFHFYSWEDFAGEELVSGTVQGAD